MRQIVRLPLPNRALLYLAKKQNEINAGKNAEATWKSARQTATIGEAVWQVLCQMAGTHARCMFCSDSRGADIEHFRPRIRYPEQLFLWENLLLVCTPCNRLKGARFDLDANHNSLLIDPTAENPWDFLFFDSHTGIITARFDPSSGQPNPKGAHTTDPRILPINIQQITDGRQRTMRRLRRAVREYIDSVNADKDLGNARTELLDAVREENDYGLANWYFLHDGHLEPPFRELRLNHEPTWQAVADSLRPVAPL